MTLDNKKRQRRKQESYLFILMGLILFGLLISGYFLFVEKVLPQSGSSSAGKGSAKLPERTTTPEKPGEPQTIWTPESQTEGGEGQLVSLYFGARGQEKLVKEMRKIPSEKMLLVLATNLVKELLRGPMTAEARSVIPSGVQLRSLFFHQGVFYLDLSKELVDNHAGGAMEEVLTIYSIVNTLTELESCRKAKVRILINGMEAESVKGHVGLRQPCTRYESIFTSATGG